MGTKEIEGASPGTTVTVQEGVKPVTGLISKATKFNGTRRKLAAIVELAVPFVKEMKQFDEELDHRPKEEERHGLMEQLQKAKELINKHFKVPFWKCCCLPCYRDEHREMDEEVRRLLAHVTQLRMARNGTELLLTVRGSQFNGLCKPPEKPELTVGLDGPLIKLKNQLLESSSGASVLVLTGFAGSGKSTLATLLCHHEHVIGKFGKNIMFVTVSKTPNLKIIVQTLFKHCGWSVPDFLSDEQAVRYLKHLLMKIGKSPMMLVLDDVWQASLIEAFQVQLPDYKILVTSRVRFPRFVTACQLGPLSTNDAVTLLCYFANRRHIPADDFVQQVARSCWGSPLALKLIGRSLDGRPIEVRRKMEQLLSKGRSTVVYNTDLRDCLQKCLDDALEDMPIIKECFMDLGLFPKEQKIPVASLIDMWTELYELEDSDIDAMNIVNELTDRHLVNLVVTSCLQPTSDADNYYNLHFLMQHDLLREIVTHQARQEQNEQRKRLIFDINENDWPLQNQQQAKARTLSLSIDKMDTPDWCNMLPVEVLEVLVLNLRTNKYSLPKFMEKMSKLKVLLVTNYDDSHFSELNNSEVLGSLSSLKTMRLQQISVPFLGKLINLRKLSLYMCNTSQAFQSDNISVLDSLPNLEELSIDYGKDLVELPVGLSGISSLKKLSITRCNRFSMLPQEIGNLMNLEILRLSYCSMLEEIPCSIGSLGLLSHLDISNCLSLATLPDEIGDLGNLRVLEMTGCPKCELSQSVTKLEHLSTVICDLETASSWEIYKPSLPNLEIKVATIQHNLNWLL